MQSSPKQRPAANGKNQLQSVSSDNRCQQGQIGQIQRRKNEFIIQLAKNYPFNQVCPQNCLITVKHTRYFRSAQYPELRRQVQANLQLKHQNLISIVRAFQSRKNSLFELYYEYIPENIESAYPFLQKSEIAQAQSRLNDLCKYLIINNVIPEISVCNIGFKDKTLKYYLDLQKIGSKNLKQKKQLATIKEIEIKSLFAMLNQRFSLHLNKNSRNSNSTTQVGSTTQSFLTNQQQNRNSSLVDKKPVQINSDKNILDLNKIRLIDDKIKQIKQKMAKKPRAYRQSTGANHGCQSAYKKKPSHSPSAPNKDILKVVNQYMNTHHYDLKQGRDQIAQPQPLGLTMDKDDDEDSVDTYNQELGMEPQIPKIAHNEMRQTTKPVTKSSQKLLLKQKLHESVGNTRFNFLQKQIQSKDTETVHDLQIAPPLRSRHVSYQQPQKSITSSGYLSTKKYQPSELKRSPETSQKKSAKASKGSDQSRRRVADHINEIRNIQKQISVRRRSENQIDSKKSPERKMTGPTGRGLHEEKLQGILKYYSFEPELMDEFNDILQSDMPSKNTISHINTECNNDSHIRLQINERVKMALKKSQATLQSIRHKRRWKLQVNMSGTYF